jgi:hypothetical protein
MFTGPMLSRPTQSVLRLHRRRGASFPDACRAPPGHLALCEGRIGAFFMVGLRRGHPVPQTLEYCERLFQLSDERLACFVAPMKPFINPAAAVSTIQGASAAAYSLGCATNIFSS